MTAGGSGIPRPDTPVRWAVVLAGGIGSRFWPLSTAQRPKQLLPLVGDKPLLADTLERMTPLVPPERTLLLTNASLVDPVAAVAPRIPTKNIVAEPRPAGTAAALTWAANLIAQRAGPDATMISVHADWAIADPDGFRATLEVAAQAAETNQALVTVGIVPTRADPGFGYIEPGEVVSAEGGGVRRVTRFVEKPSRERAARMREEGYLWNSGIFVWPVGVFLREVRSLAREIDLEATTTSADTFFASVGTPISVDHAVLERSQRVMVVAGDFGWDDVGTWGALHRVRSRDAQGNAVSGQTYAIDARDNVVHADGADQRVVLFGVNDLVVIARQGLTVVTTREASADLKRLVESLPSNMRETP